MSRPPCVVNAADVAAEKRPRFTSPGPGIASLVRRLGDSAGLRAMGVSLREVEPGFAGTNRHFHLVEEEWTCVVSGRGAVRIGPLRLPVAAGDFVAFPPGPRPHHFVCEGDDPLLLLEGGERRPTEDRGRYVDLGIAWEAGRLFETSEPLPPEEGDAAQLVHPRDLEVVDYTHMVDPTARRRIRFLSSPTSLERQVVGLMEVAPGDGSTALHTHDRTDEWVFVLAGRARVRVGDDTFEARAHDFIAHPAGSPPHRMIALEPLTYLVGGQRDLDDVVLYPEAGLRLVRGRLDPI
ncbi:MAG: cupin domain-containing protein [Thermodesulfobacteriota bacterium]